MPKSLVVIGGGAAGFFCAVNAARLGPDLKVTILEKSSKLLSKVKVSGGGRCNVTHACADIHEMIKNYPRGQHFVKKAFHEFSAKDTIEWFQQRGLKLKTEDDGRMFPETDSSQSVIDCFMREANKYGVEILMHKEVTDAQKLQDGWHIHMGGNFLLRSDYLCIATGGYPKSSMFDWLKKLGHTVEGPLPSLFTFNLTSHPITKLKGISVANVKIKVLGSKLAELGPLLITHWGLSGPAILRLSAWGAIELAALNYHFRVLINWIPDYHPESLKMRFHELRNEQAAQKIMHKNYFGLPQRLWEFLAQQAGVTGNMRWADIPSKMQNMFMQNLTAMPLEVMGKTTFKEEFVTAGGISLKEIDALTMESKIIPDLYFAGEVMDVDGITGGFNFQHAWTSGFIAAKSIAGKLLKEDLVDGPFKS